jgi:hypothetical protein
MTSDLHLPESAGDLHAARWYSLTSPPKTLRGARSLPGL